MNAADLITLATAHGVDLSRVVANASNTKGVAAKRKRSEYERRQGIEVVETARGRETKSIRRSRFSHAELSMAAQGTEDIPWRALLYSDAGADAEFLTLFRSLRWRALKLADSNGWLPLVKWRTSADVKDGKCATCSLEQPQFYVESLAMLVLDEDRHRRYFTAAPGLFAAYLHTDEVVWEAILRTRFRMLRDRYDLWLNSARGRVRAWMLENPGQLEPERPVRRHASSELHPEAACV